jgi:hypothetical protein
MPNQEMIQTRQLLKKDKRNNSNISLLIQSIKDMTEITRLNLFPKLSQPENGLTALDIQMIHLKEMLKPETKNNSMDLPLIPFIKDT